MDVIGNNIANVNTTGYKTSRTIFQDIFSQTVSGGMANTVINGGTNPIQIGLGIKLSSIDVMHTPAPYARTDNPFDMMVEGDGYFMVGFPSAFDEDGVPTAFDRFYTRAGNFKLDDQGWLTNSEGYYVLGYASEIIFYPGVEETDDDEAIPPRIEFGEASDTLGRIRLRIDDSSRIREGDEYIDFEDADDHEIWDLLFASNEKGVIDLMGFSVGPDGSISIILNNEKQVVGFIGLAMFSNPGGLEKAGNSLYRATASSGEALPTRAIENGSGKIMGGGLEMSNVDLATEFTDMIVTQRGFQANSRIITVSDTMLEELINLKR